MLGKWLSTRYNACSFRSDLSFSSHTSLEIHLVLAKSLLPLYLSSAAKIPVPEKFCVHRTTSIMPPKKEEKDKNIKSKEVNTKNGHQFQAGSSEEDGWKHEHPYKIHGNDDDFDVKWNGSCHCGRVKYQLSREVPLDAKYCHCTTCQRLHGVRRNWHLTPYLIPIL